MSQIIRIGGQSKSELLSSANLREVLDRSPGFTKAESGIYRRLKQGMAVLERELSSKMQRIREAASWTEIRRHLMFDHRRHLQSLMGTNDEEPIYDEGYTVVRHQKGNPLSTWLRGGGDLAHLPIENLSDADDIFKLNQAQRFMLFNGWVSAIKQPLIQAYQDVMQELLGLQEDMNELRNEQKLRCLQKANIIGVTSSGLARNISLLKRLNTKVVVIEEAGELLEAHSITSFLPNVEHVILIGDHKQLRPQIVSYNLSRESKQGYQYSLDVSLFERLVDPPSERRALRLPFTTLETQRRMHPSISNLIRSTLYPSLEDAPNVSENPNVRGMRKRLFWLDHDKPEGRQNDTDAQATSHWNEYELDMTVALTSHLVKQGYNSGENIAVLTPYLRQLSLLRQRLGSQFEVVVSERDEDELDRQGLNENSASLHPSIGKTSLLKAIRVATVDNFQGEEADVIIISLVRSNPERKVGFLKTTNRINVLLSRARHGMYIIGNTATAETVEMWASVIGTLKQTDCLGRKLALCCNRHPNTPLMVETADDFIKQAPEGGCQLICGDRLECGHRCRRPCHSKHMHAVAYCEEDCPRRLKCGHNCPIRCGDRCPADCMVPMDMGEDFKLDCGHHIRSLPCYQATNTERYKCSTIVLKKVSACNHEVELQCHIDVDSPQYECPSICGYALRCGHNCRKKCHLCTARMEATGVHDPCIQECGRQFTICSHPCRKACHDGDPNCGICIAACTNSCSHSTCAKRCHEPCAPCAEQTCDSGCEHTQCSAPCSAPCSHLPCSKRCSRTLECGHRCPTLCGEPCPTKDFCQLCGSRGILETQVDMIMLEKYRDVDLDQDPIIIPPCGHIITVSSLDGIMDFASHYNISESGEVTGLKSKSEPFSVAELKACPQCRGSLHMISRYGRIARRAKLDELTKKFTSWSNSVTTPLMQRVGDEQDRLAELQMQELDRRAELDEQDRRAEMEEQDRLAEMEEHDRLAEPRMEEWEETEPDTILGGEDYPGDLGLLVLSGTSYEQIESLAKGKGPRHHELIKAHRKLRSLKARLRKDEQPFQRVHDMVENLRNRAIDSGSTAIAPFEFDTGVLQMNGELRVRATLLRCELALVADVLHCLKLQRAWKVPARDFSDSAERCEKLRRMAEAAVAPRQMVEGDVFAARFVLLSEATGSEEERRKEVEAAMERLDRADGVVAKYPGSTAGLAGEIEAVRKALRGSEYCQPLTSEEMKQVYEAMASEFRGTGSVGTLTIVISR